ncbi:MAG: hypothetical protein Q9227_008891 [Pyrenula ochraceoflavens]
MSAQVSATATSIHKMATFEGLLPEIRHQIYEHVFAARLVYPRKLSLSKTASWRSAEPFASKPPTFNYRRWLSKVWPRRRAVKSALHEQSQPQYAGAFSAMGSKALLQVNRGIRQEAAFYMFRGTGRHRRTFVFESIADFRNYIVTLDPDFQDYIHRVCVKVEDYLFITPETSSKTLTNRHVHNPELEDKFNRSHLIDLMFKDLPFYERIRVKMFRRKLLKNFAFRLVYANLKIDDLIGGFVACRHPYWCLTSAHAPRSEDPEAAQNVGTEEETLRDLHHGMVSDAVFDSWRGSNFDTWLIFGLYREYYDTLVY